MNNPFSRFFAKPETPKNTMTVRQLRKKLSEYPADMPVLALWEGVHAPFKAENFIDKDNRLFIDVEDY